MKAVLISIRPKWVEKIASGEKTLEVRKTRPKLETPFKCYIYCTNSGVAMGMWGKHGKVVGEFVCDGIYPVCYTMDGFADVVDCNLSCLKPSDFIAYGKGKPLYGWHISGLKLYGEPKELSEFCFPPELYCEKGLCGRCPYDQSPNEYGEYSFDCEWKRPITRPPQSWCYVEG